MVQLIGSVSKITTVPGGEYSVLACQHAILPSFNTVISERAYKQEQSGTRAEEYRWSRDAVRDQEKPGYSWLACRQSPVLGPRRPSSPTLVRGTSPGEERVTRQPTEVVVVATDTEKTNTQKEKATRNRGTDESVSPGAAGVAVGDHDGL
jgi:hypothetical protein